MAKLPITIIMLTLNEEHNLEGAIKNVQDWAEDIFIVDSCSTDKTIDIALTYNVKIVQRPFTNFGDQWNFAISSLPIKTPWTIKMDPDERFSPILVKNMKYALLNDPCHNGYFISRRLWFMGKPLKVKQKILRLWKTGKCSFSDVLVNEHPIILGTLGEIKGTLEHLDSPTLHSWISKQNMYTTLEAITKFQSLKLATEPRLFGNALQRRMFMKKHFFKFPFRYKLLFIYYLIFTGAFLSGYAGLAWATMRMFVMKTREYKYREMLETGKIPVFSIQNSTTYDPRIANSSLQNSLNHSL